MLGGGEFDRLYYLLAAEQKEEQALFSCSSRNVPVERPRSDKMNGWIDRYTLL